MKAQQKIILLTLVISLSATGMLVFFAKQSIERELVFMATSYSTTSAQAAFETGVVSGINLDQISAAGKVAATQTAAVGIVVTILLVLGMGAITSRLLIKPLEYVNEAVDRLGEGEATNKIKQAIKEGEVVQTSEMQIGKRIFKVLIFDITSFKKQSKKELEKKRLTKK
ncbi:MAG: hypothetical protein ABH822_01050 [Patescibacteria group bacterium]